MLAQTAADLVDTCRDFVSRSCTGVGGGTSVVSAGGGDGVECRGGSSAQRGPLPGDALPGERGKGIRIDPRRDAVHSIDRYVPLAHRGATKSVET